MSAARQPTKIPIPRSKTVPPLKSEVQNYEVDKSDTDLSTLAQQRGRVVSGSESEHICNPRAVLKIVAVPQVSDSSANRTR